MEKIEQELKSLELEVANYAMDVDRAMYEIESSKKWLVKMQAYKQEAIMKLENFKSVNLLK